MDRILNKWRWGVPLRGGYHPETIKVVRDGFTGNYSVTTYVTAGIRMIMTDGSIKHLDVSGLKQSNEAIINHVNQSIKK